MISIMILISRTVHPRTFILLLFVTMACVAVPSLFHNNVSYDGMLGRFNLTGIFSNKNTFSVCSALLVITSIFVLLDTNMKRWVRWLTVPLIVVGAVQNWQSNSVAATLALLLAIAWGLTMVSALGFPQRLRNAYVTFLVTGGAIVLVMGGFLAVTFMDQLLALVNKDPTLTGRTALWFYADRLIWENPLYGIGYDAFWVRTNAVAVALFNTANGGGWTDFASDGPIHMGFSFHNLSMRSRSNWVAQEWWPRRST